MGLADDIAKHAAYCWHCLAEACFGFASSGWHYSRLQLLALLDIDFHQKCPIFKRPSIAPREVIREPRFDISWFLSA